MIILHLSNTLSPTNKSESRSFLGPCSVYGRFVGNFAHKAGSLQTLLQKSTLENFTLNEEQTQAFRDLIDNFLSPPALALPRLRLKYSVDMDTSAYGLGCSLHQTTLEGECRTIVYLSRSLISAEWNYSAPEREGLALVWALKTLRFYLLSQPFIVHTDHASLRWLLTIQEPSGHLMRWKLRLSENNFKVMYKRGPLNVHADELSRLQTLAKTTADNWDEIPSFLLSKKFSDHTEINHVVNAALPPKLRQKQNRRDIQLQRDMYAAGYSTCIDVMAPDKLFATLLALSPPIPCLN